MKDTVKVVPTGVKIIGILYYISAGMLTLGALSILFFGMKILESLSGILSTLGSLGFAIAVVVSIIMLGFALLDFFIGRGLFKLKNWARIVVIIFSIIGFLLTLIGIGQAAIWFTLIGLILNGLVGGYLIFSKTVKAAFAQ